MHEWRDVSWCFWAFTRCFIILSSVHTMLHHLIERSHDASSSYRASTRCMPPLVGPPKVNGIFAVDWSFPSRCNGRPAGILWVKELKPLLTTMFFSVALSLLIPFSYDSWQNKCYFLAKSQQHCSYLVKLCINCVDDMILFRTHSKIILNCHTKSKLLVIFTKFSIVC